MMDAPFSVAKNSPMGLFHVAESDSDDVDARSVSVQVPFGHLPLNREWQDLAHDRMKTLYADAPDAERNMRLEPGEIEIMRRVPGHNLTINRMMPATLQAINWSDIEDAESYDNSILYCLGAKFHNDTHGWQDALFLNWYLSGPEMDLVLPHVGRRTIRPGDVFVIDPSQPHGVLPVGAQSFDANAYGVYPQGAPELDDGRVPFLAHEHSIFAAYVIPLSPVIDRIMGIERGSHDMFNARQGWVDLCADGLNIHEEDGRIVGLPAHNKMLKP